MNIVIFDDDRSDCFYPLTQTRSTGDLRCGILKLRQRLQQVFDAEDEAVIIDEELVPLYRERHPEWSVNLLSDGEYVFINSRLILTDEIKTQITQLPQNHFLSTQNDEIVALRSDLVNGSVNYQSLQTATSKLDKILTNADLYQHPGMLIRDNGKMIDADFEDYFSDKGSLFETEPGVTCLNPYNIWIGEGVELQAGVIIDASEGAVVIDDGAKVMHQAVIVGPSYIGKHSTIKIGAKIYEGTSIGARCKVGGEVEETIIQAYSNKQHDGFLGHSYVGEWVNLGADTNNSDLKNNYKLVSIYSYREKQKIDSGMQFLGAFIGDHVKTGINCTINTGCSIGIGSNLWERDLISDFIPAFSWGEALHLENYLLEAFLATAEVVKKRRNLSLSKAEAELYRVLSQGTI